MKLSLVKIMKMFIFIVLFTNAQHTFAHDGICSFGGSSDYFDTSQTIDSITLPTATWSGAANSIPPIWVSTATNGSRLKCYAFSAVTSKMTFTPATAPIGQSITVSGITYPIFSTPITGIGYILALNTIGSSPIAIGSGTSEIGNNTCLIGCNGFKFTQRIQLVSTGSLPSGSYTIPSMTLGTISVIPTTTPTSGGTIASNTKTLQLISNPTTLSLTTKSCIPTINNIQIAFPNSYFTTGNILGKAAQQNFSLGLNCTQGAINAYITFSDANNPGNNSDILSLAPSSTASGLGIQLKYNNGNAIQYGLDSPNSGTTGQFLLQNNVNGLITLPFTAAIIKTGTMSPGSFTARATFTFSYQ